MKILGPFLGPLYHIVLEKGGDSKLCFGKSPRWWLSCHCHVRQSLELPPYVIFVTTTGWPESARFRFILFYYCYFAVVVVAVVVEGSQLTPLLPGGWWQGQELFLVAGPLPFPHDWLLAAEDGAGPAGGGHAQIGAVGTCFCVPCAGCCCCCCKWPRHSCWWWPALGRRQAEHRPSASGWPPRLCRGPPAPHPPSCGESDVDGLVGLRVIGVGVVRLLVPLDQVAGAVPCDRPWRMGGHGDSSSHQKGCQASFSMCESFQNVENLFLFLQA